MPRPQRLTLSRFVPRLNGEISEWPAVLALKPVVSQALRDNIRTDHTYYLAWDVEALYLAGDIDDASLIQPLPDQPWQGDALSLRLRPTGAAQTRGGNRLDPGHLSRWRRRRPTTPVCGHGDTRHVSAEARIPATALAGFQPIAGTS